MIQKNSSITYIFFAMACVLILSFLFLTQIIAIIATQLAGEGNVTKQQGDFEYEILIAPATLLLLSLLAVATLTIYYCKRHKPDASHLTFEPSTQETPLGTKKAIQESDERFQAAIAAVQGILWTNNAVGEMEGEQLGWASITGQSYDEYQGYGWATAVHPDDADATVEAWNEAVRDRKPFIYEHRVKTKEGTWGDFSIRAIPLINDDGAIRQWVGVHTNITEQKEALKKIKESEERFRSLADESPMFVFLIDPDPLAPISYWNKTWLYYTGQTKEEAAGRAWNGIIHPDDMSVVMDYYLPAFDARQAYFIPAIRVLRHDGEYRWHSVKGNPRYLPNGDFDGYIGVGFDIHEQKLAVEEIRESEQRFRSLAQTLPQLVWVTDAQGNAEFASGRWEEYTGITPKGEKEWNAIVHPDDLPKINTTWMHSLTTGDLYTSDVRLKNKVGEYRWHTVVGEPVRDKENKIVKWVGAFNDTHSEKLFTQELEMKVKQRTYELQQINIELENKNKELESFAYISSHDLQEPLRKIRTFATRIVEKEYEVLSQSGKDSFNKIRDAAERMQILIQDLLAHSQLTITERQFERTDLTKIVDDLKEDLSEELQEKHATIEVAELCEVDIIPFQFRQLMQNLVSNALKFSVPNQPPHITIKAEIKKGKDLHNDSLKPQQKYCHITFADNGIGFEPQYGEKIFEVFQRLHGRDQYNGTGIGLAIVKKIVENHDGIITAEGEPNKGVTFHIYIPAA